MTDEEYAAKLETEIVARLAPIKSKLDDAYAKVDALAAENKKLKEAEETAKVALLAEQGRKEEALQLQLDNQKAETARVMEENTRLARDSQVRSILSSVVFKSDSAATMAFNAIVSNLTKDANGAWVDVPSTARAFLENPDNSFLLKVKNSGGYSDTSDVPTPPAPKKSPSEMTTAEMLAAIKSGELKRNG